MPAYGVTFKNRLALLRSLRPSGDFESKPDVARIGGGATNLGGTSKMTSSPQRTAALVLGMHRSGTSAIAGVLSALGAAIPKKTLMGADSGNERRYFEAYALVVAHDLLLTSAGSCWHDWRQFDARWLCSTAAEPHRQRIKALLVEEFDDEPFIVVKDPRICRFVPFISSILAELKFGTVAILPVRNPLEVAYSLKRRNGFPLSKSSLLWLRHVLDAEFNSRHMPRCFVSYEQLLANWRYQVDRITEKTGLVWPDRSEHSDLKIDQFLTTELRHERASFDEIEERWEVPPLVRETYTALASIADSGETKDLLDRLDRARFVFDQGCALFGPAVAEDELAAADSSLIADRNSLAAALNKLTADHDSLIREHNNLAAGRDPFAAAARQRAHS